MKASVPSSCSRSRRAARASTSSSSHCRLRPRSTAPKSNAFLLSRLELRQRSRYPPAPSLLHTVSSVALCLCVILHLFSDRPPRHMVTAARQGASHALSSLRAAQGAALSARAQHRVGLGRTILEASSAPRRSGASLLASRTSGQRSFAPLAASHGSLLHAFARSSSSSELLPQLWTTRTGC